MKKNKLIWKKWFLETLAPYGANILAEKSDEYGAVRVIELGGFRALYFDSEHCQGRVNKEKPWKPASEYLYSTLLSSAYCQQINQILLLGLGPAALVHSFHRLYPNAKITCVELREVVCDFAHLYFDLSDFQELKLLKQDAADFLKKENIENKYDLVIVDLAMSHELSPVLLQSAFWEKLSNLMHQNSVLSCNLWDGHEHRFEWITQQIKKFFSHTSLFKHQHLDNLLLYASHHAFDSSMFKEKAISIEQNLEISFASFLQQIEENQIKKSSD